jgi:hypothetical protein
MLDKHLYKLFAGPQFGVKRSRKFGVLGIFPQFYQWQKISVLAKMTISIKYHKIVRISDRKNVQKKNLL